MQVTSTDFKMNFGHYLEMAAQEDIIITKNGRRVAKLVGDNDDLVQLAQSLFGVIPNSEKTVAQIRAERLKERYERDD
ncbi:MAG: type II toxin-antitoxin system prevent-host-death family antitoxin [Clostridiales bacterium]|nr:type II toxin-antitoxin system prevent-host-death family antitoxin [Clostridiales bacterium]